MSDLKQINNNNNKIDINLEQSILNEKKLENLQSMKIIVKKSENFQNAFGIEPKKWRRIFVVVLFNQKISSWFDELNKISGSGGRKNEKQNSIWTSYDSIDFCWPKTMFKSIFTLCTLSIIGILNNFDHFFWFYSRIIEQSRFSFDSDSFSFVLPSCFYKLFTSKIFIILYHQQEKYIKISTLSN